MVEDALRGMVRNILEEVADQGLPGDHHLYITFNTDFPGVKVAEHLINKYPDEMTIVLQHKFWGLKLNSDSFEVTLSFNGVNEDLLIPFEAITGFADPSVNFGLRFDIHEDLDDEEILFTEDPVEDHMDTESGQEAKKTRKKENEEEKVVSLDSFRKKFPSKNK